MDILLKGGGVHNLSFLPPEKREIVEVLGEVFPSGVAEVYSGEEYIEAVWFSLPPFPELIGKVEVSRRSLQEGESSQTLFSWEEASCLFERGSTGFSVLRQLEGVFCCLSSRKEVIAGGGAQKGFRYAPEYEGYRRINNLSPEEVRDAFREMLAEYVNRGVEDLRAKTEGVFAK